MTKAYTKSDKYVSGDILGNLALLSYNNENYKEALDLYLKSLVKFEAIDDVNSAAIARLSIVFAYSQLKEFDKASPYLEEVKAYAEKIDDPTLLKNVYATSAKLHLDMGEYEESIDDRKKVIAIASDLEDYAFASQHKLTLAQTYLKIGKLKPAEIYNNEAFAYYKQHPNYRGSNLLYENFYNIYKSKGEYKKSLESLETKIKYQDSLKAQEVQGKLNEERANIKVIEAQESVNRTEKEKELLESEAALLSTRNRLYIILGILATVLFVILFINSRYRSKIEKQNAVEKLRSKISADLHDDVGSVLTGLAMKSELLGKNAPEDIRIKLDRLSEISRSAMLKMRDAVWVMDARKDNWQSLIDRINEFAVENLSARELKYNLSHTNTTNHEEIAGVTRQHLYLVAKEAIANILKHSNADVVHIDLDKRKAEIALRIKDNGQVGEQGTAGLGVSNMKHRIDELHGKFEIRTTEGYEIAVKVPA